MVLFFPDRESPKIQQCPTNLTRDTDPASATAVVISEDVLATDNSGDAVNVVCSHVSEAQLNIGHTEIVCEAVDGSGNTGECQFSVTIKGMATIFSRLIIFCFLQ